MRPRGEPRFNTEADVTIQLLRKKAYQPGTVVDVSSTGFRLLVNEAVAVDEPLRITVGNHHLLAIVRYCVPVKGVYSVGVERIDEWLPEADATPSGTAQNPDDSPAIGRPQIKGHLGFLRTLALREQFSRHSPAKGPHRLLLVAIAASIVLGLLVVLFLR